jgi:hypothetical protein
MSCKLGLEHVGDLAELNQKADSRLSQHKSTAVAVAVPDLQLAQATIATTVGPVVTTAGPLVFVLVLLTELTAMMAVM